MEQYKFVKELEQGGFGRVWLVKGVSSRKQYVLKQINLQRSTKRDQRAAHLEVKLLSTVQHSNIVTYLDSFYNSNGSLFIVMGYCERGDMYNYINKQNGIYFEERQIVRWFVQLCFALKFLHDKNILHRDLKTKNLYLTRGKLIKIGDLGIARVLNGGNDMALTAIGTPFYMSPEALSGQPYNHKSDIWGLGCCMYEIITLKQAFLAEDYPSLIQKVMGGKVPLMPDTFSEDLVTIVLSMLSQDPSNRPSVPDILLTAFIKKSILLFLEESSGIVNVLKKKEKGDCSSPVTHTQSGKKSVVNPSSKSNCNSLPHNGCCNSKNPKPKTETLVVTVPDINGNGDGNDNSQHRYTLTRCKSFKNSTPRSDASVASSKENMKPKRKSNLASMSKSAENATSCGNFAQNKSSHHSVYSNAEKQRGERSIEFLFNLTYTLKQARSSSVPSDTYCTPSMPNVQPSFLLRNVGNGGKSQLLSKSSCYFSNRSQHISPSVKSDSALLSYVKDGVQQRDAHFTPTSSSGSNSGTLVNIVLPEVSKILFPVRGSSADSELYEKTICDSNINDGLLAEILNFKKSNISNSAARQRRREKLKATCLATSAPAKVESLPVIFNANM